jgi:NADPH-dependent 2,4-dienoyl-CoA reductase/sulfur reductase-like enzyme
MVAAASPDPGQYVELPPRRATHAGHTEILVVGGGPAGLGAALGAAAAGAEVMLVERYGFLGGNAAGNCRSSWSRDLPVQDLGQRIQYRSQRRRHPAVLGQHFVPAVRDPVGEAVRYRCGGRVHSRNVGEVGRPDRAFQAPGRRRAG